MHVGRARRPDDAIHIRFIVAEADVARDGVVEEIIVLQHESDLAAQVAVIERFEIKPVKQNRAIGRFEQSSQAFDQSCLARTAAPDDGDQFARRHVERHAIQNLWRFDAAVLKPHVPQTDRTIQTSDRHEPRVIASLLRLL
ncbi:MAG: hypothetical protein JMDDDDMK_00051 [Acidobacteria bacterium]|nr:hypothetical protein [Acidobacteriota bacterium]